MKTKFRQNAGDGGRLFVGKSNPDPFANDLGHFIKTRRFTAKHRQQMLCVEGTIEPPYGEVNLFSVFGVRLFGVGLLSSDFWFFFEEVFMVFFFVHCCSFSVCRPLTKKAAEQGGAWE